MVFNSITFLFWFLPIFLILVYICKLRIRNAFILLASFFVCAWGSEQSLSFLVGFILVNWAFGLLLDEHPNGLSLAVVCDVALLFLFKYFGVSEEIPFGLSFYTLSGISYCVDIAKGKSKAAKNPGKLALYLAFFPKLCMGPIVQYQDFDRQFNRETISAEHTANGLFRFSIGLAKKIVIAASLVDMTNYCWIDAPQSTASAWLGLIGFSLQLYFDFSGYSDMALGLSEVCGYKFKENFLYPYQSSSLSEFWSHWHISLGAWLKEYLYFPLGGSRKSKAWTCFNLLIVWLATGIWHGNNLSLICWGLFIFIFVLIEHQFELKGKLPKPIGIILTDFIVILGWVFFNSPTVPEAIQYFGYLFGASASASSGISSMYFTNTYPMLIIAILGATAIPKTLANKIFKKNTAVTTIAKCIFMLALLCASVAFIVSLGYTPFIYESF